MKATARSSLNFGFIEIEAQGFCEPGRACVGPGQYPSGGKSGASMPIRLCQKRGDGDEIDLRGRVKVIGQQSIDQFSQLHRRADRGRVQRNLRPWTLRRLRACAPRTSLPRSSNNAARTPDVPTSMLSKREGFVPAITETMFGDGSTSSTTSSSTLLIGLFENVTLIQNPVVKGASLECGGLAPLWNRSRLSETKAAPGRRTPRRRPLRLCVVQEILLRRWSLAPNGNF